MPAPSISRTPPLPTTVPTADPNTCWLAKNPDVDVPETVVETSTPPQETSKRPPITVVLLAVPPSDCTWRLANAPSPSCMKPLDTTVPTATPPLMTPRLPAEETTVPDANPPDKMVSLPNQTPSPCTVVPTVTPPDETTRLPPATFVPLAVPPAAGPHIGSWPSCI